MSERLIPDNRWDVRHYSLRHELQPYADEPGQRRARLRSGIAAFVLLFISMFAVAAFVWGQP